jgi:hypothetical protein
MEMPEAAMNEDDGMMSRQDDIRFPRQSLPVKSETESRGVKKFSHDDFRFGVAPPDCRHISASGFGIEVIGHTRIFAFFGRPFKIGPDDAFPINPAARVVPTEERRTGAQSVPTLTELHSFGRRAETRIPE